MWLMKILRLNLAKQWFPSSGRPTRFLRVWELSSRPEKAASFIQVTSSLISLPTRPTRQTLAVWLRLAVRAFWPCSVIQPMRTVAFKWLVRARLARKSKIRLLTGMAVWLWRRLLAICLVSSRSLMQLLRLAAEWFWQALILKTSFVRLSVSRSCPWWTNAFWSSLRKCLSLKTMSWLSWRLAGWVSLSMVCVRCRSAATAMWKSRKAIWFTS